MKKDKKSTQDPTLKEIEAIKRLFILFLIKGGASQGEIATALNMDQGNLSRMFPARKFKPFPTGEKGQK
jgi:DNA-binding MarR family transcriptional regulator